MQQQKMNDEYPIVKRIWLAQPHFKEFFKAMWTARPVHNENSSSVEFLVRPTIKGWSHEPYELYVHQSVDALEAEIIRLKELNKC